MNRTVTADALQLIVQAGRDPFAGLSYRTPGVAALVELGYLTAWFIAGGDVCRPSDKGRELLVAARSVIPTLHDAVRRAVAMPALLTSLEGRRCPDCGDFDCPADPGF